MRVRACLYTLFDSIMVMRATHNWTERSARVQLPACIIYSVRYWFDRVAASTYSDLHGGDDGGSGSVVRTN